MASVVGWIVVLTWWVLWLFKMRLTFLTCLLPTVFAVCFSVYAILRVRRLLPGVRDLRLGRDGEVFVGQFLDEHCRERGYKVLHDLVGDDFNVDHFLIGPRGVFAIETKARSKPVRGSSAVTYDGKSVLVDGHAPDRDPIIQAQTFARHVEEILARSTGWKASQISARPVVLFPGWYVKGSSSGRKVWVLNESAFLAFLDCEQARFLPEDVNLLYSHLTLHIQHTQRLASSTHAE